MGATGAFCPGLPHEIENSLAYHAAAKGSLNAQVLLDMRPSRRGAPGYRQARRRAPLRGLRVVIQGERCRVGYWIASRGVSQPRIMAPSRVGGSGGKRQGTSSLEIRPRRCGRRRAGGPSAVQASAVTAEAAATCCSRGRPSWRQSREHVRSSGCVVQPAWQG